MILCTMAICKTNAQDADFKRKVGITASLQQGDLGIRVPIWFNDKFALVPAVSVVYAQDIGTDFSIGLSPRYYFKSEKIAPYFAVNLALALLDKKTVQMPFAPVLKDEPMQTDIIAGLAVGAEYFFVPQFSMGIELQANMAKSDNNSQRFGNPGKTNFNTGSMISASIYF